MDIWNLIIVLCFFLLYLGLAMVFSQIRHLREELRMTARSAAHQPVMPAMPTEQPEEGEMVVEAILRELEMVEGRLGQQLVEVPQRLESILEDLRREMQFIQRSVQHSVPIMSGGHSEGRSGGGSSGKGDAYREAKLLLSNGVDEERVIEETGLTVEEVSLLKRLSHPERPSAHPH
ncbi:MAG: hypothetical protein HQL82_08590 [Magnetococcales bacterium]|nr:hypothetical protein [Magnetococcales bacterium]